MDIHTGMTQHSFCSQTDHFQQLGLEPKTLRLPAWSAHSLSDCCPLYENYESKRFSSKTAFVLTRPNVFGRCRQLPPCYEWPTKKTKNVTVVNLGCGWGGCFPQLTHLLGNFPSAPDGILMSQSTAATRVRMIRSSHVLSRHTQLYAPAHDHNQCDICVDTRGGEGGVARKRGRRRLLSAYIRDAINT